MRFRNKCYNKQKETYVPVYFPYAGEKDGRGRTVGADELSRELPASRFLNPLLQRDWKKGTIEVILSDADRAALGDAVLGLDVEPVKEENKDDGTSGVTDKDGAGAQDKPGETDTPETTEGESAEAETAGADQSEPQAGAPSDDGEQAPATPDVQETSSGTSGKGEDDREVGGEGNAEAETPEAGAGEVVEEKKEAKPKKRRGRAKKARSLADLQKENG